MMDTPVIHINHADYIDVDEQLSQFGYRCFVKLRQNQHVPEGHYAIGKQMTIEGGMHPLWVLYENVRLCG